MSRRNRDATGKFILRFIGVVVALFIAMNIFFVVYRSRVLPKSIAERQITAEILAKRDWKVGTTSGKLTDGKIDESNLPPSLPGNLLIKNVENYSDTFNTYTVFEFEIGPSASRSSIQVGKDFFTVHR